MNLEGFTMSKLTKKDKIHIFEEWTLEKNKACLDKAVLQMMA